MLNLPWSWNFQSEPHNHFKNWKLILVISWRYEWDNRCTHFCMSGFSILIQTTLSMSKSRGPDKIPRDIGSLRKSTCDVIHLFHELYRNQYLEIICVGCERMPLIIHSWKTSVSNACLVHHFLKSICETHLSTWHSFSNTSVPFDCCLHQRTPLNGVQSLKLRRHRYVLVGLIIDT